MRFDSLRKKPTPTSTIGSNPFKVWTRIFIPLPFYARYFNEKFENIWWYCRSEKFKCTKQMVLPHCELIDCLNLNNYRNFLCIWYSWWIISHVLFLFIFLSATIGLNFSHENCFESQNKSVLVKNTQMWKFENFLPINMMTHLNAPTTYCSWILVTNMTFFLLVLKHLPQSFHTHNGLKSFLILQLFYSFAISQFICWNIYDGTKIEEIFCNIDGE